MLKVYGWIGRRQECEGPHHQTREIVAAKSKAEVQRLTGMTRSDMNHSLVETGNALEIQIAMAKPGTVFWCGLNDSLMGSAKFTEAQ